MDEARGTLDDRSPYEAAVAVVRTIAKLSPELRDEAAVWKALAAAKPGSDRYFATIAEARHSIFYQQLQEMYEFGRSRVPPPHRDGFCVACGRTFSDSFFAENVYPLLQVGLARPGSFQATVVEMIRSYLHRYTGGKYVASEEVSAQEIAITLENRAPEPVVAALRTYGLDPQRCFRNSFDFIAGAIEGFVSRVMAGFDPARVRVSVAGEKGTMRLPVRAGDRFAFETLVQTLVGYVRELEARAREQVESERRESSLVIGSPKMREVWDRIRRASRSSEIVLLRGESGTGKSYTARKIHDLSPRRDRPYVEVGLTSDIGAENMIQSDLFGHEKGAFTGAAEAKQGLFQLADEGTIFLDEVGDASAELQAKLLRVLEKGQFKRLGGTRDLQVDVRVIAATNRDLERLVKEGSFRQDLYYRLNVIPIELPPLRQRPEDIPPLSEFLLARSLAREKGSQRRQLEPGLPARLRGYGWPGNIRELDHAVKYALAMTEAGETVRLREFPEAVRAALGDGAAAPPAPAGPVGAAPSSTGPAVPAAPAGDLVDVSALRRAIRESDPVVAGTHERPWEIHAHIDHVKRLWLATLIDEFAGDLALIGKFWDRGSEKTLRNLVREYGLVEQLAAARARGRPSE